MQTTSIKLAPEIVNLNTSEAPDCCNLLQRCQIKCKLFRYQSNTIWRHILTQASIQPVDGEIQIIQHCDISRTIQYLTNLGI